MRLALEIYIGIGLFMSDTDDFRFEIRWFMGTLAGIIMHPIALLLYLISKPLKRVASFFELKFFYEFYFTDKWDKTEREVYDFHLAKLYAGKGFIKRWIWKIGLNLIKKRNNF